MAARGRKSFCARCGLSAGDGARSVGFSERTELDLRESGLRVVLYHFCKRIEVGKKSFHAVYLKKRKVKAECFICFCLNRF